MLDIDFTQDLSKFSTNFHLIFHYLPGISPNFRIIKKSNVLFRGQTDKYSFADTTALCVFKIISQFFYDYITFLWPYNDCQNWIFCSKKYNNDGRYRWANLNFFLIIIKIVKTIIRSINVGPCKRVVRNLKITFYGFNINNF